MAIPTADRIINLVWTLPDHTDKRILDAYNVMLILDQLMNGQYPGQKLPTWTTATRPGEPGYGTAENRMEGTNTDPAGTADGSWCKEIYMSGWFVMGGAWYEGSQPTDVLPGSSGYNITQVGMEVWDGGSWQPLQS